MQLQRRSKGERGDSQDSASNGESLITSQTCKMGDCISGCMQGLDMHQKTVDKSSKRIRSLEAELGKREKVLKVNYSWNCLILPVPAVGCYAYFLGCHFSCSTCEVLPPVSNDRAPILLQTLELKFGVDVVAGAQKTVSQKCTLEKLCRALQEEHRSLEARCSQQPQEEPSAAVAGPINAGALSDA